jgi:hypothetical protein
VDASLRCEPDRPSSNSSCHSISQHVDNFGNHSKVITSPPLHCYVRQELGLGSKVPFVTCTFRSIRPLYSPCDNMWRLVGECAPVDIPTDGRDARAGNHRERAVRLWEREIEDDLFFGARKEVDIDTDKQRVSLLSIDHG